MTNAKDLITTMIIRNIPLDSILMNPHQMRMSFDEEELETLANSIKLYGVLQPILVVLSDKEAVSISKGTDILHNKYVLIAGERRLRACKRAGLTHIPALIRSSDSNKIEIALRENIDRVDLHPIEEGDGYQMLLHEKFYSTHEEIAKAFKKSKSRITECIGFTSFPNEIRFQLLQKGIRDRDTLRTLMNKTLEEQMEVLKKREEHSKNKKYESSSSLSPKVFKYEFKNDAFKMNAFKWKKTQSREELNKFKEMLKNLLHELDKFVQ